MCEVEATPTDERNILTLKTFSCLHFFYEQPKSLLDLQHSQFVFNIAALPYQWM